MTDQPTPVTVLSKYPDRSVAIETLSEVPAAGDTVTFDNGTTNTVDAVAVGKNGRVVVTWADPPTRGPKGTGGTRADGRKQ